MLPQDVFHNCFYRLSGDYSHAVAYLRSPYILDESAENVRHICVVIFDGGDSLYNLSLLGDNEARPKNLNQIFFEKERACLTIRRVEDLEVDWPKLYLEGLDNLDYRWYNVLAPDDSM